MKNHVAITAFLVLLGCSNFVAAAAGSSEDLETIYQQQVKKSYSERAGEGAVSSEDLNKRFVHLKESYEEFSWVTRKIGFSMIDSGINTAIQRLFALIESKIPVNPSLAAAKMDSWEGLLTVIDKQRFASGVREEINAATAKFIKQKVDQECDGF